MEDRDIAIWTERRDAILASYVPTDSKPHEIEMFFQLGKRLGANPFLREIFMSAYNTKEGRKVSIFCGRDFYRRRGQQEPDYRGIHCDAHYSNDKFIVKNGIPYHEYDASLPRGNLLGAYCLIWRNGHERPAYVYASFSEFCQYKDNRPVALWATKPEVMIKKCAESLCWRVAYQGLFRGTYDESEKWVESESEVDITPRIKPVTMQEIASEEPLSRQEFETLIPDGVADTNSKDIIKYILDNSESLKWTEIMGADNHDGLFARLVKSSSGLSEKQRNLAYGELFARLCDILYGRDEWEPDGRRRAIVFLDELLNSDMKTWMTGNALFHQRERLGKLAESLGVDFGEIREERHVKDKMKLGVLDAIKKEG